MTTLFSLSTKISSLSTLIVIIIVVVQCYLKVYKGLPHQEWWWPMTESIFLTPHLHIFFGEMLIRFSYFGCVCCLCYWLVGVLHAVEIQPFAGHMFSYLIPQMWSSTFLFLSLFLLLPLFKINFSYNIFWCFPFPQPLPILLNSLPIQLNVFSFSISKKGKPNKKQNRNKKTVL